MSHRTGLGARWITRSDGEKDQRDRGGQVQSHQLGSQVEGSAVAADVGHRSTDGLDLALRRLERATGLVTSHDKSDNSKLTQKNRR